MSTTILLSTAMLSISSSMLLTMNPLSLGIIILLMAINLALIFSSLMSSWVAFLIFLIYVSGMLVMFAYFVSLIPNQSTNLMSILLPSTFMMIMMFILLSSKTSILTQTQSMKYINTFYSMNNASMLLILALTLLLAMIVVVKIVINNKGPLRPFMQYV